MNADKELLVMFTPDGLSLLVPRRYWPGFLHQPLAHRFRDLARLLRVWHIQAEGLHGSIDIRLSEAQRLDYVNDHNGMITRMVVPIAMHFGFDYRVVDSQEFWSNHPYSEGGDHV